MMNKRLLEKPIIQFVFGFLVGPTGLIVLDKFYRYIQKQPFRYIFI